MDSVFREMFEALKHTAEHMIEAHQHMILATEGVKRATEAALRPKDEHEDLRETVRRLEGLVTQQGHKIRALRTEFRGGDAGG